MKFHSETELAQWIRKAGHLWLFLDYDGTLADFTPTPDQIEPNPKIISVLEGLARQPNIRIAILSGRRLPDIRLLLPIAGIFLAGTYGIEIVMPSGETVHRVKYGDIRPFLEMIKPQWEQLIRGRRGFFLEDKDWTLALHARFADDNEADQIIARARKTAMAQSLPDSFRILEGHKFLEIAPLLASKREAVAYLLDQYPLSTARLLYFGDDIHDEEAFSVIHAHHGIAVKVLHPPQASESTSADFCFKSPIDTLHWLEQFSRLASNIP